MTCAAVSSGGFSIWKMSKETHRFTVETVRFAVSGKEPDQR